MELVGHKNVSNMKCPAHGVKCASEITVAVIQSILTPDEFNQYLEVRVGFAE